MSNVKGNLINKKNQLYTGISVLLSALKKNQVLYSQFYCLLLRKCTTWLRYYFSDLTKKATMPAVKGDNMRGLLVFISDIRNCKLSSGYQLFSKKLNFWWTDIKCLCIRQLVHNFHSVRKKGLKQESYKPQRWNLFSGWLCGFCEDMLIICTFVSVLCSELCKSVFVSFPIQDYFIEESLYGSYHANKWIIWT